MSDGRSNRKFKVLPFVDRIERDRKLNHRTLVRKAKLMKLEGFEGVKWDDDTWMINGGRLFKLTGKNINSITINFSFPPKIGSKFLPRDWADVLKSLFILRFHRKHQALPNQRSFITTVGYIAYASNELGLELLQLTPEVLDNACSMISCHFKDSTAYNMHKHAAEFAAHCDANGLCRVLLQYKFSKMKRPERTGGLNHKRLDDPTILETKSDKLVDPLAFKIIGELYLNVPKNHKNRFYILMLVFIACTGRRFSEISLLPYQELSFDSYQNAFIEYFPRKASWGDVFTPKRKLYLPSEVVPIVRDVLNELILLTAFARSTSEEMQKVGGPDLRFIADIPDSRRLYISDLVELGLSESILDSNGWLKRHALAWPDSDVGTTLGNKPSKPVYYANKESVKSYCNRNFLKSLVSVIHVDQFAKQYFLKDMAFVRPLGLSSGAYAHWLATTCTQSMFTTFMRYLPSLATQYASCSIEVDFTSHHFRHTLNTLLDEGGLSDLLQTEWFGRTNSRDTKVYQHTSREKRALMLREDIKKGLVGGQLAEQIKIVSVDLKDAILKARVQAVHDVGTGICIHNFSQTPCERHLQCSADCKDYVWVKNDKGRLNEQKRQFALTMLARKNAEKQMESNKPKKSADWLAHNDKKLKILAAQLADNGVEQFDPGQYLNEAEHG